jgi:CheY-like chemotaxis protein
MNQRILIVVDGKEILSACKKMLQSPYIGVDTAKTVDEAQNLLKKNIYNVVIVDRRLTGGAVEATHDSDTVKRFAVEAEDVRNQVTRRANKAKNTANAGESAGAAEELTSESGKMRGIAAGLNPSESGKFIRSGLHDNKSQQREHTLNTSKKGGKVISGLTPGPCKVIPLYDKDHNLLITL